MHPGKGLARNGSSSRRSRHRDGLSHSSPAQLVPTTDSFHDYCCKCSALSQNLPHPADGGSSTGQVAIHAALLPGTYKVLLFGRNLPKSGLKSTPEPNIYGNVSTVYDVQTGNYRVTPNFETLFCAGHTIMSDGNVVAAGGDWGLG